MKTIQKGIFITAVLLASFMAMASQSYRWDVNSQFATFKGTLKEQHEQVDSVLSNTARIESMTMFVAADTAYMLDRVVDAGFLFHAAKIRAASDLKRYPSSSERSDGPGLYLSFLRSNAGRVIYPATTKDAPTYIAIASKLAKWDCNTIAEYTPGWEHRGINITAEPCEKWHEKLSGYMQGMAELFANPDYAEAFQVQKKYNLSSYKNQKLPAEKAVRDKAVSKMLEIETKLGIKGFTVFLK